MTESIADDEYQLTFSELLWCSVSSFSELFGDLICNLSSVVNASTLIWSA